MVAVSYDLTPEEAIWDLGDAMRAFLDEVVAVATKAPGGLVRPSDLYDDEADESEKSKVRTYLGRLAGNGLLEKEDHGKYRVPASVLQARGITGNGVRFEGGEPPSSAPGLNVAGSGPAGISIDPDSYMTSRVVTLGQSLSTTKEPASIAYHGATARTVHGFDPRMIREFRIPNSALGPRFPAGSRVGAAAFGEPDETGYPSGMPALEHITTDGIYVLRSGNKHLLRYVTVVDSETLLLRTLGEASYEGYITAENADRFRVLLMICANLEIISLPSDHADGWLRSKN